MTDPFWTFSLIFLAFFGAVGVNVWRRQRRYHRFRFGQLMIDDPQALAEAEREVRGIPETDFVHLATFDSMEGYSEPMMMQLVQRFWDAGIQVTLDRLPSPGGSMRSFTLKC